MHYPPETSTINLVVRLLAMAIQNPGPVLPALKDFQSVSENPDLLIFHKMLGENFSHQIDKLRMEIQTIFGGQETVGQFLTEDGFRSIFALIGTNSQGIGTSPFADWVKNVSEKPMSDSERSSVDELIDTLYSVLEAENESFLNAEGAGLYSLQSKINHSCEPNAEIKFPHSNHVLAVTATKPIAAGEEVSISYLSECDLERSRHSRQKTLKENYLFVCECPLCCRQQADDPGVTSEEEMDTDDGDEADSD
jgi:SET and MYND domain-containing protein 5